MLLSPFERSRMVQSIAHIALVVRDYDEAIAYYCDVLDFDLLADEYQPEQDKRWVLVRPKGGAGTSLLLARADGPDQEPFVGAQSGGRVFFFWKQMILNATTPHIARRVSRSRGRRSPNPMAAWLSFPIFTAISGI